MRLRTPCLSASIVVALGCAPPGQQRYEEALADSPPSAQHAVHAARLGELMRGLERLTDERLPQALDVAATRESRVEGVREVALAVADSAMKIQGAAGGDGLGLDADSRAVFVGLAEELDARARTLAAEAPDLSEASLEERFVELRAVCDRCHERFRLPW